MSVVKDVLKRHDDIFDIIEPTTINLDGFPFNMCPVLRFTEDGISLSCPIAYYVTEEQRDLILDICKKNKTRVWYTDFGWGPFISETDESGEGKSAILPEGIIFDVNHEEQLITANYSFDAEGIMATPEEFYHTLNLIEGYARVFRIHNQDIHSIIYDRMVKTKTNPSDPRSLFLCSLLLYYRNNEAHHWLMVDFNDVKALLRRGRELVFYPSLIAESFDGLVNKMENTFREDLTPEDQFDIIVTLTLPESFRSSLEEAYNLIVRYSPNYIKTNIYLAEGSHPFTAEMVLVKRRNRNE